MARWQPSRPTALIVEDEHLNALDLERAMADLGYEVCLAASESRARFLAMQRHRDIVLINVCLGREGIETGVGCERFAARQSFSLHPRWMRTRFSASTSRCLGRPLCQNPSTAIASRERYRRPEFPRTS